MKSPKSSKFRVVWHRSPGHIPEQERAVENGDLGGATDGDARRTFFIKREC